MISFFVHGEAVAKGSTKAFTPKGWNRPVITSSAKGLGAWERRIADVAQDHAHMFEGAIGVCLTFYMPRPKSLPKTRPSQMTKRPDIDKLARAALDALTGVFFTDDARVTWLMTAKRYAEPGGSVGVCVAVWEISESGGGRQPEGPHIDGREALVSSSSSGLANTTGDA